MNKFINLHGGSLEKLQEAWSAKFTLSVYVESGFILSEKIYGSRNITVLIKQEADTTGMFINIEFNVWGMVSNGIYFKEFLTYYLVLIL